MSSKPVYKLHHITSSILMMLALVWLTICTPFVYEEMMKQDVVKQMSMDDNEEECPLSNTTEEKSENGMSSLSEYLHDFQIHEHSFLIKRTYYKCHISDLYFAFHPELISPPPKANLV